MLRWTPTLIVIGALGLGGCELLVSDSASRTAFALRDGARRLADSGDSTITVRVAPRQWPRGCRGAYRLTLVPDSSEVPGLAIRCLPAGPVYTSGDALVQVKTREVLTADFGATEPVTLLLRRDGKDIEVSRFTTE